MKKHMIAAAVSAAFAVPAAAQVTVSGTLDISAYETFKVESGQAPGVAPNEFKLNSTRNDGATSGAMATSELKFDSKEDLGGGLSAFARFSQQLNVNGGGMTGRDGYIGLSGAFGKVQLGRMNTAINGAASWTGVATTNTLGSIDSVGSDFIAGTMGVTPDDHTVAGTNEIGNVNSASAGSYAGRTAGVIQYTTPSFSGLRATAEMIAVGADNNGTGQAGKGKINQFGLVLDYKAGPFAAALAHGSRETGAEQTTLNSNGITAGAVSAGSEASSSITWLGASYDFGAAKLFAFHGTREDDRAVTAAVATTQDKVSVSSFGIQVPLGSVTLNASMFDGSNKQTVAADDDRDAKGMQLAARYALSKRTYLYAVYGSSDNKGKTPATPSAATDKVKATQTAFGVVHSF